MKPFVKTTDKGFTLVELLVVITIIAVLAGVAMPVFNGVQMKAKITAASAQTHGIHIGLMQYASDNDGTFPTAKGNSNDGLKKLVPRYVENEKPFFVAGSAWHKNSKDGKGPDNDFGSPPGYEEALTSGENHWAYVTGLTNSSDSNLPLIADGFSESVGVYTNLQTKKGGVWKGTKAIVCYADGSIRSEEVEPTSYKVMKTKGGNKVDLFSSDYNENFVREDLLNPMD